MLVGACASRRGMEDGKSGEEVCRRSGEIKWWWMGLVKGRVYEALPQQCFIRDGICEGKGVRDACPTNAFFAVSIVCGRRKKSLFILLHLLKSLLERLLCVVGMEEHVGVEVETGDIDIGPSEPLMAIKRGDEGEKSSRRKFDVRRDGGCFWSER
jgi:hypothetical protein